MAKYTFVVFSEPAAGREDEYNSWYDRQHLGDVLAVPGFVACQRFRLQPDAEAPADAPAKYLALYEIETDDLGATMAALGERAGTPAMPISEALSGVRTHMAEAIGERRLAAR
jgi:hypothetical protein